MRDPYDILGVKRGASFKEIKAAYHRESKRRHPDKGGPHEAMVELNVAYAFILDELTSGHQQQSQQEKPRSERDERTAEREQKSWEQTYRDIDEEFEAMRREAKAHEEAMRQMRSQAWRSGDRATWAKLTWEDIARFFGGIAKSGVKGLALLFAALVGVGSVLVEANFVSALILLGSGLGFAFSLALKSDKGGMLSAALLLFGMMTIWLPPVRSALFLYPLATISVLILLALVFKFAQAGGTVGLMTGGLLGLYVIGAIITDTAQLPEGGVMAPPPPPPAPTYAAPNPPNQPIAKPSPPSPPEPRTLLAADGAILKFVAGVSYHLKVRNGYSTSLHATQGKISLASADGAIGECLITLDLPVETGGEPWHEIDRTFRACGDDALMAVALVK